MDIIWNNKEHLGILGNCEKGEVVILRGYPGSGPFLVIDPQTTTELRLLFDLNERTSKYISPYEQVEVLRTELHIL